MYKRQVQSHHRLVKNPELRVVNKRTDNAYFLLHAVRIRFDRAVERVGKIKNFQHFFGTGFAGFNVHSVNIGKKINVFFSCQFVVNNVVVRNVADIFFGGNGIALKIDSANLDFAFLIGKDVYKRQIFALPSSTISPTPPFST